MDADKRGDSAGQCNRQLFARPVPIQQSEVLPHAQNKLCRHRKHTALSPSLSPYKLRSCQDEKAVRGGQVGAGCLI